MAYDWFPPNWWTYEISQIQVDCTDEDLTNFIERSLSFQWRPVPDYENVITDTGKVSLRIKAITDHCRLQMIGLIHLAIILSQ